MDKKNKIEFKQPKNAVSTKVSFVNGTPGEQTLQSRKTLSKGPTMKSRLDADGNEVIEMTPRSKAKME